jgi:hypothetical protein
MIRAKYTLLLLTGAMLALSTTSSAQAILGALDNLDALEHTLIGDGERSSDVDTYGALPYGKGNLLFLSNGEASGLAKKDPFTNLPFSRPKLLRLKDKAVLPYELTGALANLDYYIGPSALLPDSSGIIVSHSRPKPSKDGRVRMTLTLYSFTGAQPKELPFVDATADYQHPFFDADSYTLYFASNQEGGKGGYDLYASTLSFDGVWSAPSPVDEANTNADEVFPTLAPNLNFYFSRASRNYGLQIYALEREDSTGAKALTLNGRGDDMGLLVVDDSTVVVSQSKRPGSPAKLHFYSIPAPEPTPVVVEEAVDSAALAQEAIAQAEAAKAAALAAKAQEAAVPAEKPAAKAPAKNTKTWVTDNSPEPGTGAGFSVIVGGFVDQNLAENFLESIVGWAPESFLSKYNGKYYVVHSVHNTRAEADRAKAAVNNRDARAWVLSKGLKTL